jgi:hypothetical protein
MRDFNPADIFMFAAWITIGLVVWALFQNGL